VAEKTLANTRTMGVALSPCIVPQVGRPTFTLAEDEMEIGMGIHGEPGVRRERLRPADSVLDAMLDPILAEMAPQRGDQVAALVNSLGATSYMELYILYRRLAWRLKDAGLATHAAWVGPYCTSLDMAGASVTLMRLDAELTGLLDHPCDAAMFWSRPVLSPARS